jgi:hypothetical protein
MKDMTKLYFSKVETLERASVWYRPVFAESYMLNGEILANLSNHAMMKLSDILRERFSSVRFSGKVVGHFGYLNDFIFTFEDNTDEDFFLMWSSEGIEI